MHGMAVRNQNYIHEDIISTLIPFIMCNLSIKRIYQAWLFIYAWDYLKINYIEIMKSFIYYDNYKNILLEYWRWMVASSTLSTSDLVASAALPSLITTIGHQNSESTLPLVNCIVLYLFQIPTDPCTGKRTSHKPTGYRKCQ
jgi:hypothetical protein